MNFKLRELLLTAFMIMLLMPSCTEQDIEQETTVDSSELRSEVGEFHNVALRMYHNSTFNYGDYKDLRVFFVNELTSEYPELFNEDKLNVELAEIDNLTSRIGLNASGRVLEESSFDDFSKIINYMEDNLLITEGLANRLTEVNESIESDPSNSDANLSLVNGMLNEEWSDDDKQYVEVFVDVYNNSSEYWNGEGAANGRVNADGDEVILADAAGALYGLLCGAPWSIIEGALFSVIANNQ